MSTFINEVVEIVEGNLLSNPSFSRALEILYASVQRQA